MPTNPANPPDIIIARIVNLPGFAPLNFAAIGLEPVALKSNPSEVFQTIQ